MSKMDDAKKVGAGAGATVGFMLGGPVGAIIGGGLGMLGAYFVTKEIKNK